jgi:hypothetical protein
MKTTYEIAKETLMLILEGLPWVTKLLITVFLPIMIFSAIIGTFVIISIMKLGIWSIPIIVISMLLGVWFMFFWMEYSDRWMNL